ncbi:E3 ubiquitin ligase RBr family IBR domain protein [Fadolivirus algeromassiliense]|jgi:ariadne-1|uniref:RBR-type E3 ubiquitin transferase n=1 Tax=Fadolivirus FV1/VV64 TaxID=3070911 RepID=A0A7D3UNQ8_9VIRU|nr:E3 ubiquitin ligase RBr family IBR domain protein [Fadolivirus algeromassiliense]QKF93528.1 E3 ubiquitin ligase RBr family IBR domain protein [Fadolivirus FV1/VV64]
MEGYCTICSDHKELIELECGNTYCFECLENYIIEKVNDSEHEINCPNYDCNETISYRFVDRLFSEYIVRKLDRNIIKHTVNSSDNFKFCPKCDAVCEKDYYDTVECGECGYIFCYICGYNKDDDHECKFDLIDEVMDALEFNYDDYREVKLCPKCHIVIHRYGGCDSVKCSNCRFRFCWKCLKLDRDIQDRDQHKEECYEYRGFDEKDSPDPSDSEYE